MNISDKKIELNKNLLSTVIESSRAGMVIINLKAGVLDCNNIFLKIFDYNKKDIIGLSFYEMRELIKTHFKNPEKLNELINKTTEEIEISSYEKMLKPEKRTILFNSRMVEDEQSFSNYDDRTFVWSFTDFTLTKKLDEKLKKTQQRLDDTNKKLKETQLKMIDASKMAELGQLISGIAHEIKAPLGAIYCNIDLFSRQFSKMKEIFSNINDTEKKDKIMKIVDNLFQSNKLNKDASQRIIEMVDGIKTASRCGKIDKTKVNIEESIDITLSIIKHEIKDIEIVKEYGNIAPIMGYSGHINQVFTNLLVNAAHAINEANRKNGKIIIKTQEDKNNAIISIVDNGTGISPSNIQKIFKKGYTTKKDGKGMGLGLYIVAEIIREHKGIIEVVSKVDIGTTFTIVFPKK